LNLKQNCGGGEWCIGSDFNAKENKVVRLISRYEEKILFKLFVDEKEIQVGYCREKIHEQVR
jgi:hypothetical protein